MKFVAGMAIGLLLGWAVLVWREVGAGRDLRAWAQRKAARLNAVADRLEEASGRLEVELDWARLWAGSARAVGRGGMLAGLGGLCGAAGRLVRLGVRLGVQGCRLALWVHRGGRP